MDEQDLPTFLYEVSGSSIEDKIRVIDHKYLERNINIKNPAAGQKIRIGMSSEIKEMGDGWTIVTKDHSLSAQWEHTVLVTETGYEVLTISEGMPALPAFIQEKVAA